MPRTKNDGSRRVTLADVASRAHVSVTTVSLILSGREEWLRQFHPDTVAKVRKYADRLGYRANLFASGLPSKATLFFAIVVHDVDSPNARAWHHWVFEGAFMGGVIQRATEREVYPILATADERADEERIRPVKQIIDGGVFGAIIRTPNPLLERFLRARLRRGQRIVVAFPRKLAAWPSNAIDVDNAAIGETVGNLFAARGRKQWLFARCKAPRDAHRLQFEALNRVAERVGATVQTIQLPMDLDETTAGDFAAPRIRRARADAIFGVDPVSSAGSLFGCLKNGMKIAEDVDLIGCDCSLWRDEPMPTITAVDVSWNELGSLAMDKLLELAKSEVYRFDTILVGPRVVPAETCPVPSGFVPVASKAAPAVP
jgi:DNA-binding LacI/PurR family transcriptional regulator